MTKRHLVKHVMKHSKHPLYYQAGVVDILEHVNDVDRFMDLIHRFANSEGPIGDISLMDLINEEFYFLMYRYDIHIYLNNHKKSYYYYLWPRHWESSILGSKNEPGERHSTRA